MKIIVFLSILAMAAGQTFPIAGTVVDGESGRPLGRVRVTLAPSSRPSDQRSIITAADGRFLFDVPKGKFGITAEYRGLRQPFGQSGPATGFGVAIFNGPDQDASHLVFRWFAPGAITGKIVDDRGEPVESALVQLIRVSVSAGRKIRRTVAWARTDDLGEYRFGQFAGGTYYLVVTGEPWYAARSRALVLPGQGTDSAGEPAPSFLPAYYPNSNDPNGAQPLELTPGAEVRADFRLSVTSGVNVHVHCPHTPGQTALVTLLSDGAAGVDTNQRQVWLMGNDQTTIAGVLPGRYIVSINGRNGTTASARKAIDVGASDVTVEVTLEPAPTVSGKVVFKDAARRPRRPAYLRLVDESTGAALARPIDSAGMFSFDNVPPGKRRVQLSSADGFFAAEIDAEGTTINGPALDIAPGAKVHLSILATDEVGTLRGFVMKADKPVPGVLVVLAPKMESKDPTAYRGFQTDSDGSFDYQNVRAGDYILFAIDRLDFEYANPVSVCAYLVSGKPIHIGPHAVLVEDCPLLPFAQ